MYERIVEAAGGGVRALYAELRGAETREISKSSFQVDPAKCALAHAELSVSKPSALHLARKRKDP
jgi:hypothetical protein